jgi:ubiquinone/menaquinone biosynthesis C-methylase UbiE
LDKIYEYPGADDPETYELENLIADPDCLIEAHMERIVPMVGKIVLDVGAGSGFHTARFARSAAQIYAVEPAEKMCRQFEERFQKRSCANVRLLTASTEQISLPDTSIDIAHARFAYFFGSETACDPGIAEVKRVLKSGGYFFIIDNCYGQGEFAKLCEIAYGRGEELQKANEAFYCERGFDVTIIESEWRAPNRETLVKVLRMEFPEECVTKYIAKSLGASMTYIYAIYHFVK